MAHLKELRCARFILCPAMSMERGILSYPRPSVRSKISNPQLLVNYPFDCHGTRPQPTTMCRCGDPQSTFMYICERLQGPSLLPFIEVAPSQQPCIDVGDLRTPGLLPIRYRGT